jgi:hypothetical protein
MEGKLMRDDFIVRNNIVMGERKLKSLMFSPTIGGRYYRRDDRIEIYLGSLYYKWAMKATFRNFRKNLIIAINHEYGHKFIRKNLRGRAGRKVEERVCDRFAGRIK